MVTIEGISVATSLAVPQPLLVFESSFYIPALDSSLSSHRFGRIEGFRRDPDFHRVVPTREGPTFRRECLAYTLNKGGCISLDLVLAAYGSPEVTAEELSALAIEKGSHLSFRQMEWIHANRRSLLMERDNLFLGRSKDGSIMIFGLRQERDKWLVGPSPLRAGEVWNAGTSFFMLESWT